MILVVRFERGVPPGPGRNRGRTPRSFAEHRVQRSVSRRIPPNPSKSKAKPPSAAPAASPHPQPIEGRAEPDSSFFLALMEAPMTKRALRRLARDGEFNPAQFEDDGK